MEEEWIISTDTNPRLPYLSWIQIYDHGFAPPPDRFDVKDSLFVFFDVSALVLILYYAFTNST